MIISSRGRYALRVMLDLAGQGRDTFVPLKEIAARQELSQKYLESIMVLLSRAALVESVHGKGGGLRLKRAPEEYRVSEILRLTEGELTPVACQCAQAAPCGRAADCLTRPMWDKLSRLIDDFFQGITLADLLNGKLPE